MPGAFDTPQNYTAEFPRAAQHLPLPAPNVKLNAFRVAAPGTSWGVRQINSSRSAPSAELHRQAVENVPYRVWVDAQGEAAGRSLAGT